MVCAALGSKKNAKNVPVSTRTKNAYMLISPSMKDQWLESLVHGFSKRRRCMQSLVEPRHEPFNHGWLTPRSRADGRRTVAGRHDAAVLGDTNRQSRKGPIGGTGDDRAVAGGIEDRLVARTHELFRTRAI